MLNTKNMAMVFLFIVNSSLLLVNEIKGIFA